MYKKVKVFTLEESAYHPGKYIIDIDYDAMHLDGTSGSYNVLMARLMNLSYAQYCRFCRDVIGAELIGKNKVYVVPYFEDNKLTRSFVDLLNARANLVLWEREHPDWQAHAEYVATYEEARKRINEDHNKEISH